MDVTLQTIWLYRRLFATWLPDYVASLAGVHRRLVGSDGAPLSATDLPQDLALAQAERLRTHWVLVRNLVDKSSNLLGHGP